MTHEPIPAAGFGLGLRAKHFPYIFEHFPAVDWFEVISENYMDTGGKPLRTLARIRERYPVVLHGVSLSIGTVEPRHSEYLRKLKRLIDAVQPLWVSDHLCWTGTAHTHTHDLLPIPYREEALTHLIQRVREVQDYLGRPIALENPSTYLEFKSSGMPEAEFLARLAEESGCWLLLDVNNVYVTCYNHRLDPKRYIDTLPLEKVVQIHLSGHTNKGTHIIDTHDDHVIDAVWRLYRYTVFQAKRTPNTMVEWDENIPEFPVLHAEMEKARAAAKDAARFSPLPVLEKPRVPYALNAPAHFVHEQERMEKAIVFGARFDSAPETWILPKEEFSAEAQLSVYINAYRFRLFDTVAEDYAVLKRYLGKEAFSALIRDFVRDTVPSHFNIARYPAQLPAYLAQRMPENLFAQEICALECAIVQLAHAQESEPLREEHLAGMSPEKLLETTLRPREALALFAFSYPVNAYFRQAMEQPEGEMPIPTPEESFLAVFRHEDTVWRLALAREEHALLSTLFAGATVGDALQGMDGAMAEKLHGWFARWRQNGLLAAPEQLASYCQA